MPMSGDEYGKIVYEAPKVRRLGPVAALTKSQNLTNADDLQQLNTANPFVPPADLNT